MPLSVDSIVQHNSGSFNGSSGNATLPVGVTAGSTVIAIVAVPEIASDFNIQATMDEAGFEAIAGVEAPDLLNAMPTVWAKRNVAGGTTSWGITPRKDGSASSRQCTWWIAEVTGVGLDPLGTGDLSWYAAGLGVSTAADATSISTGATSTSGVYDALGLAVFAARSNSATIPTFDGYTNGWEELADVGRADGGVGFGMAVAVRPTLQVGSYESTATVGTTSDCAADAVMLYADGARHAPALQVICGAEFGSMTGAAWTHSSGVETVGIFDSATSNVVTATNVKRTGSYSLKYTSTSAPSNTTWAASGTPTGHLGNMANRALVTRLHLYFDGSLPGVDVELATIEAGSLSNGGRLTYRTASQKLELKLGTGTAVLSDAVISAGQWIGVDLRYDPRGIVNAQHVCDWAVDYNANLADTTAAVAQTQAVGATTSAADITVLRKGWTQSITATVYMDDIVVSRFWGTYPLDDHRVRPLKVDAAGTPTLSGTTANFKTFTSNGTMANWTAAATRTALDDVPPTIGASSDGLAQVSNAANDYVEIPMETFDAAANDESVRGLMHYVNGWAASGNPASIGAHPYDGRAGLANIVSGAAGADNEFDSSNSRWMSRIHQSSTDPDQFLPVTQAHLDALAIRVGFSNDTNPDCGIHCVLSEVATAPLTTWPAQELEDGNFKCYAKFDPVSRTIGSLTVATPAGTRGATLQWAIDGVDQTAQHVNAGQLTPFYPGAETVEDLTSFSFTPDATT